MEVSYKRVPVYVLIWIELRNLLECLLVDGVDLAGDAVVVVGELPDELLLGVCHGCKERGHGQEGGKDGAAELHCGDVLVLYSRLGVLQNKEVGGTE